MSARFAVTSVLSVCRVSSSLALAVQPRRVGSCDVDIVMSSPRGHRHDVDPVPKLVRDVGIAPAVKLCAQDAVSHFVLDLSKQVAIHRALVVREQKSLASFLQFGEERVAHWNLACALRSLRTPYISPRAAILAIAARDRAIQAQVPRRFRPNVFVNGELCHRNPSHRNKYSIARNFLGRVLGRSPTH